MIYSESKERQPDVIQQGKAKLINFNHVTLPRANENGEIETFWRCEQVRVSAYASRGEVIQAVIRNKYSEPGEELALINNMLANPDDETAQANYAEYQLRRQLAKSVADSA